MTGEVSESGGFYRVNFLGVIAGIALILLPVLDVWWFFALGNAAVVIAYSPFQVLIQGLGTEITSPLIASLSLALKVIIIYYGALLVAGSVLRVREERRTRADFLVRVSAKKFLWLVLFFVVSVAVSDFIINEAFALTGVHAQVPYFVGDSVIPLQLGGVSVKVPVTQGFTGTFTIAVLVAILSLLAYIYQKYVTIEKTERGPRFRRIPGGARPLPEGEERQVETGGQDR
jgi:hypothetical protein